jgi:hypothetical protein
MKAPRTESIIRAVPKPREVFVVLVDVVVLDSTLVLNACFFYQGEGGVGVVGWVEVDGFIEPDFLSDQAGAESEIELEVVVEADLFILLALFLI